MNPPPDGFRHKWGRKLFHQPVTPTTTCNLKDTHIMATETVSPAAAHLSSARDKAANLHANIANELAPLLRVARNFADSRRVLAALEDRARIDPTFEDTLSKACDAIRNPHLECGYELLDDLLRVTSSLVCEYEAQAQELENSLRDAALPS